MKVDMTHDRCHIIQFRPVAGCPFSSSQLSVAAGNSGLWSWFLALGFA